MMTAGGRWAACKRLRASRPSMPGSHTSSRITSTSPVDAAFWSCRGFLSRALGGSGCRFSNRQLDHKARTSWEIIFDVNAAAMFCNNARGDGQPQARSAIFGRKLRQEKFVLILRGDAVPGVLHTDFDSLGVVVRASDDCDLA